MTNFSLNRIRILKTGLANIQKQLNMQEPGNRLLFERIAQPGTRLKLKRVYDDKIDPFRINVYSINDIYLGKVTYGKNETAARLMDAGLDLVAIVNESLPIHNSDHNWDIKESGSNISGWSEESRKGNDYSNCNLPYCIYLIDD